MAVDKTGDLYVADTRNHVIRKVGIAGAVTNFAGVPGSSGAVDGARETARFLIPTGVAVDLEGTVYVADLGNSTIRRIGADGLVTTVAGVAGSAGSSDGIGTAARFTHPAGIAVDRTGNVYVADTGNSTIRKISAVGEVTTIAGSPGVWGRLDGQGSAARFNSPTGIAVDAAGTLYVADRGAGAIRKIASAGVVTTLAGGADVITGSVTDGAGNGATFLSPSAVAIDQTDTVFVADAASNSIRQISPTGAVTTLAGSGDLYASGSADGIGAAVRFSRPGGIAVDGLGRVYVADTNNGTIRQGAVADGMIAAHPRSQILVPGSPATLSVITSSSLSPAVRWQRNGADVGGATAATFVIGQIQPVDAGLYCAVATNEGVSVTSAPAVIGILATSKVVGSGEELQPANIRHPNGNTFDQVLLAGAAEAITADAGQITRTSFVDLDDDIVQVEFSGPGTLSLVLDNATGPAAPVNYNQATNYMKGHAGIVITGATEQTNVSVFSVGKATAVNQALFKEGVKYDGIADLAFIAILSSNGKFGGVRTANANYFAAKGLTGLHAPGVAFQGPVFIGNITAFEAATPVIQVGSVSDARITGGDLAQANGAAVEVSGLALLKFTDGGDSHGNALPAQKNKAVLKQDGVDVTAEVVAAP